MNSSWATPDPRRVFAAPPPARPADHPVEGRPSRSQDARAGLLAFALTVLVGAPVGLLWAAVAPRVTVVVEQGQVRLADSFGDGFIAVDGFFLAAVTLAGVVGGLVAHRLADRHGPAVVVALAAGGLVAAYVAMVVGEQVGLEPLRARIEAGAQGRFDLAVDLRATPALVGWPVGSLLAYVGAVLARSR